MLQKAKEKKPHAYYSAYYSDEEEEEEEEEEDLLTTPTFLQRSTMQKSSQAHAIIPVANWHCLLLAVKLVHNKHLHHLPGCSQNFC